MFSNTNKIDYSDFKDICRTCMLNCDVKIIQDATMSDIFYKLTDIRFETNDDLPKQICLNCFEKINDIHEFTMQCKRTHSKLIQCLNDYKMLQINKREKIVEEINELLEMEQKIKIEEDETNELLYEDVDARTIEEHGINELLETIEEPTFEFVSIEEFQLKIKEETNNEFNENIQKPNINNLRKRNRSKVSKKFKDANHRRLFKCDQCVKTYVSSRNLKRHKRMHSGERPYECDECPKTYYQSGTLAIHKRVHSGERPFKCDECANTFTQSHHLTIHKRVHSGERPFKCSECPKSFPQSSQLKAHKHVHVHSVERPYKCDQCTKSYSSSQGLKYHKYVHKGVHPYKNISMYKGKKINSNKKL